MIAGPWVGGAQLVRIESLPPELTVEAALAIALRAWSLAC